jgi:hypothetical protein
MDRANKSNCFPGNVPAGDWHPIKAATPMAGFSSETSLRKHIAKALREDVDELRVRRWARPRAGPAEAAGAGRRLAAWKGTAHQRGSGEVRTEGL